MLFAVTTTGLYLLASLAMKRPTRSIPSLALTSVTFVLLLEEAFLNGLNPSAGLGLALLAALSLPLAGSISKLNEDERYALQACGLMFATRLAFIPFPQRFLINTAPPSVYALVIALIIAFLVLKRISLSRIGLTRSSYPLYREIGAGASIGILSGLGEYLILKPSPIRLAADNIQATLYVVIVMTLFVGLGEEMLFRGLVQESYQKVLPSWSAILIASLQFGIMHYGWFNPLELLFAYGMGIVFGYSFWKTKSLVAPVTIHSLGNIVMFHIAAYPELMLSRNALALTIIIAAVLLLPMAPWRGLSNPKLRICLLTRPVGKEYRSILKEHIGETFMTARRLLQETRKQRYEDDIIYICPYCRRALTGEESYCDICGQQLLLEN